MRPRTARQEILDRIETALNGRRPGPEIPREYHGPGRSTLTARELIARFEERVGEYHATVRHCGPDEIAAVVAATVTARGAERMLIPPGLPATWFPAGIGDEPELSLDDLDHAEGVITSCVVAIAETGTIVLDHGPGQGRRALTLIPDFHLVVVRAEQILPNVPEAITALDPRRPMTWISGPSATSDIELSRVEGVHGPRRLDVIIVSAPPESPPASPS